MDIVKIDKGSSYVYLFSPNHTPIFTTQPGNEITVETEDAFGGAISITTEMPSESVHHPYVNPLTGPIYITGAEPGDAIGVEILEINPIRNWGASWIAPNFGGLVGTSLTRLLHPPLKERLYKYKITNNSVWFDEKIKIPYEPFFGTIATAPELESISILRHLLGQEDEQHKSRVAHDA